MKPGICRACQFVPSFSISSSRREFQRHIGVHIGGCHAYRAYITDLFSYGSDVKNTWLKRLEGWHEDQEGKYDDQSNTGLRERTKMISNSRSFDVKGRLHIDMLLQERLLPNNLAVKITLVRAEPQFSLMSFETTVNG